MIPFYGPNKLAVGFGCQQSAYLTPSAQSDRLLTREVGRFARYHSIERSPFLVDYHDLYYTSHAYHP
jgi:hypothetical protein